MLHLLLTVALAQQTHMVGPCERARCSRVDGRRPGFTVRPLFEFAPADGAGMSAACACTTPTGSKGEALTFTRASSATCLKSGTVSGIANGDMVTCTNNQPRVMPGGDGTGGNGLLVESARTNDVLRSAEIDNAAWTSNASGVAVMTVTANAAVAPDGTLTAERLQIPAAGATGTFYSQRYQLITSSVTDSCSVFVMGNGTSGTFNARMGDAAGGTCLACPYNASTWSRCSLTRVMGASAALALGSFNTTDYGSGNCNGTAFDGYVTAVQCEVGATASSYIATAGATVARAAESASVVAPPAAFASAGCAAATALTDSATGAYVATNDHGRQLYNGGGNVSFFDGSVVTSLNDGTLSASIPKRFRSVWAGSSVSLFNVTDNTSTTGVFDGALSLVGGALYIGGGPAPLTASDGVIKQVQADIDASRCR